jgi:cytochrome c554/c'-like protein/NapC/NirT cytochrome c family protein
VRKTLFFLCNFMLILLAVGASIVAGQNEKGANERLGELEYGDFQRPKFCGTSCHVDIYRQWQQEMHSQAYEHHWDEIEYFKLAIPHARLDEKVAEVEAGCNGCHTPMAFLAGDIPPPEPGEGSRANEAVSCDICHSITGFAGEIPHNFNYTIEPGNVKYGPRGGASSPEHEIVKNEFLSSADFCGTCHNEMNPYGLWVKSTHLEWQEGPYSKENVPCHDCHMPKGEGVRASMGKQLPDMSHHLFHGAHDDGKLAGALEVRIHPDIDEAEPGEVVRFTAVVFNQKAGHMIPTGSVEDRIVWMHVEATDSKGNTYHIPVDKKGFEGEEWTIANEELAYQDMGIALQQPDFPGVRREEVPVGDRIFRMPYFDSQGRMTTQQWNTTSLGVDYRVPPRGTRVETYTFNLPYEIEPGEVSITATVNFRKLVKPVAEFLEVPEDEYRAVKINEHTTTITVFD